MKLSTLGTLAVTVAVALAATNANAARVFLTTAAGPLSVADLNGAVPTINGAANTDYTLHAWLLPDENQDIQGWSLSLATNKPGTVTGVSRVVDNPTNGTLVRYTNPITGGTTFNVLVDPDGAANPLPVESFLVNNFGAANPVQPSSPGIGTLPKHLTDPGRDLVTGAFHLGSMTVHTGTDTSGPIALYLRVGSSAFNIRDALGNAQAGNTTIFFGESTSGPLASSAGRNRGDALDANGAEADAMITFGPIGPVRELVERPILVENLPPNIIHPGVGEAQPGTEIVNDPIGAPRTDISYLNYHGQGPLNDSFAVYVDLTTSANSPTMAAIIAQINAEMGNGLRTEGGVATALPGTNELLNGLDYDFVVSFPHGPADGTESIDLDFSSLPGVSIANVAIPEPSTMALAAMGLIGVVLAARRRRAA